MRLSDFTDILRDSFHEAFSITLFVFAVFMVVEYLNLLVKGRLAEKIGSYSAAKPLWGALLGSLPGCLGTFMAVTLYQHGVFSVGALLSCLIVTTGDEAFFMLATMPGVFVGLTGGLFALGLVVGVLWDRWRGIPGSDGRKHCGEMIYHSTVERPEDGGGPLARLRANLSVRNVGRWAMLAVLLVYGFLVVQGTFLPEEALWVRLTVVGVVALGILCVALASDHFLKDHLWGHVVRRHLPKVFLWILGTLLAVGLLHHVVDVRSLVSDNRWLVLGLAALVGLLPTSGPHLVFVTLFLEGLMPWSVLVVNAIVQEGHGGLPLMAFDRKAFALIKLAKLALGLAIGSALAVAGW